MKINILRTKLKKFIKESPALSYKFAENPQFFALIKSRIDLLPDDKMKDLMRILMREQNCLKYNVLKNLKHFLNSVKKKAEFLDKKQGEDLLNNFK